MNRFGNYNYGYNNNQIKYPRFNRQRFGKRNPSSMQHVQNYYQQYNRNFTQNPNYNRNFTQNPNYKMINKKIPKTINNIKNNINKAISEKSEEDDDDDEIGVSYIIENCPSIKVVRNFFKDQVKYIEDEDDDSDDLNLN